MVDWAQVRMAHLCEKLDCSEFSRLPLPILPTAVRDFLKVVDQPDCDVRHAAGIVESDAGLSCELLRTVNSNGYGVKQRIASVHHAVAVLGVRRTKLVVMTTALRNALPIRKTRLINIAAFWNANLERACFARRMARLLRVDQELAFSGALLQDFLLPALTNRYEDVYVEFLRQRQRQRVELSEFERHELGWSHGEVAACLMHHWGFPDDLICCVLLHHRGLETLADEELRNTAVAACAVSSLLPDPLRQSPHGLRQLKQLGSVWDGLNLSGVAEAAFGDFQKLAFDSTNHVSFCELLNACRCRTPEPCPQ